MNTFFSIFRQLFERDSVTAVCALFLIAAVIAGFLIYRKHTKKDNAPDLLDYDGYYKIAQTPAGYAVTNEGNLFRTLSTFYYLRKDPFDIEVSIDEIEADNGKKYRALALTTVLLCENRIDYVCNRYFGAGKAAVGSTADVYSAVKGKSGADPDALYIQLLNSKGAVPYSGGRSRSGSTKTNCDADIDAELTIAFSSAMKRLVKEYAGTADKEEIRKKFLGEAMLAAMTTGHAVTQVTVFNIIEITE